jgi:hypothetical protein
MALQFPDNYEIISFELRYEIFLFGASCVLAYPGGQLTASQTTFI